MKRMLKFAALLACIALTLTGCGQSAGSGEPTALRFADATSVEKLKALDGKPVTITGYMATLSPLDGAYIYLMNLPYQSCPFCVPNTTQLANTMAVYAADGTRFEFTDRPVRITGTLRVADKVDGYGYAYSYYIDGARYETVDLSGVSREYSLYQSLAEDGVIADVNAMFDYLMFVCQWTEYTGGYTDNDGNQVTYFLYPGDVQNYLADDGPYGFAKQSSEDYFPGLIRRVEAVSADGLTELVQIIADAQAVAQYARSELDSGHYAYDEAADKYTLTDSEGLYDRFYEVYGKFSEWLTRYQL